MLVLENITIKKSGKIILDQVNLTVQPGDKILIRGPSGSGKSTLLKTILFFTKFNTGRILFHHQPAEQYPLQEYRRNFAYIGQKAPLYGGSVNSYLLLPFIFKANSKLKLEKSLLHQYLHAFNFEQKIINQNYNELSGGEKQRVTIIQSLLLSTLLQNRIYLLDEITSSLDADNIQQVVEIMTLDQQLTAVIVSHQNEWRSCASIIYEFIKGKLVKSQCV